VTVPRNPPSKSSSNNGMPSQPSQKMYFEVVFSVDARKWNTPMQAQTSIAVPHRIHWDCE
jgi:hypothetical protein